MRHTRGALLAFALAFAPIPVRAATLELPSAWVAPPSSGGGAAVPWEGVLLPLGESGLSVAFRNDQDFLYLRVRTSDPETRRQLFVTGLTIWADGRGKSKRDFGVRFPLRRTSFRGREGAPGDGPAADEARGSDELELIGPGEDDRIAIPAAEGDSVRATLDASPDVLTIEVRLPLHPTSEHPLSVGAAPGATITVGFESEKPRRSERETEGRGGFRGGMGGGGMGGRGGGGGMRGPGGGGGPDGMRSGGDRRPATPKPIKLWTRVALAAEPPSPAR
jgi:hypothetical protein